MFLVIKEPSHRETVLLSTKTYAKIMGKKIFTILLWTSLFKPVSIFRQSIQRLLRYNIEMEGFVIKVSPNKTDAKFPALMSKIVENLDGN